VLGKEVATLVNEERAPGTYEVTFDAGNLASGVYFYKLQSGGMSDIKKLVVMK
ncbi:MAG: T9SS type A sorting domain-containing protein, partial [Ignavibacteriae bacterium]|nr:T9SS type A sorting domain-containing protein [Ignavibacteriota bacterium]